VVGIQGDVIPLVAREPVRLGGGVAVLLLLGDEGPLLIELDLRRPRGKKPRTRRGVAPRGGRPAGRSGPPCPCRRRPTDRSGGRRSRRPGALARPRPCLPAGGCRTAASPCARRSAPCRSGSGAAGAAGAHSAWARSGSRLRACHSPGKRGSGNRN